MHNEEKLKNPTEFVENAVDCRKMDRALEKAAKEGGIFSVAFSLRNHYTIYYILWKPFMQMEDYI